MLNKHKGIDGPKPQNIPSPPPQLNFITFFMFHILLGCGNRNSTLYRVVPETCFGQFCDGKSQKIGKSTFLAIFSKLMAQTKHVVPLNVQNKITFHLV